VFEEVEQSWAQQKAEGEIQDDAGKEYAEWKRSVYSYWQSIFHYKEWSDEAEDKKAANRQVLKEKIRKGVAWMKNTNSYWYEDFDKLMKNLQTKFPFNEAETDEKSEIKIAEGAYNLLVVVIDSMYKKLRVKIVEKIPAKVK